MARNVGTPPPTATHGDTHASADASTPRTVSLAQQRADALVDLVAGGGAEITTKTGVASTAARPICRSTTTSRRSRPVGRRSSTNCNCGALRVAGHGLLGHRRERFEVGDDQVARSGAGEPIDSTTITLGGSAQAAISDHGRRSRRYHQRAVVGEARRCDGRAHPLADGLHHLHHEAALSDPGLYAVTRLDGTGRLCRGAVDDHSRRAAKRGRRRSGRSQPHRREPHVDPDTAHPAIVASAAHIEETTPATRSAEPCGGVIGDRVVVAPESASSLTHLTSHPVGGESRAAPVVCMTFHHRCPLRRAGSARRSGLSRRTAG